MNMDRKFALLFMLVAFASGLVGCFAALKVQVVTEQARGDHARIIALSECLVGNQIDTSRPGCRAVADAIIAIANNAEREFQEGR